MRSTIALYIKLCNQTSKQTQRNLGRMNPEFDIFKEQENEYKITILYILKNVNQNIKERILNLVHINLEKEMNYIDYFEEIFSHDCMIAYPHALIEWENDPDCYQSDYKNLNSHLIILEFYS